MRAKATISSFVLVVSLYFLYGWGLVPLVLPSPSTGITEAGSLSVPVSGAVREEIEPFIDLLPEGGWEHDPNYEIQMLQFDQIILLFREDGFKGKFLTLKPCTILILPDGVEYYSGEESRERIQRAVVLRAPSHAEIQFDRDFDIGRLPLPKPVEGRLYGTVTVQSGMKGSDNYDDFYLETENIEIKELSGLIRIEALREVQFNLGLHSGIGNNLVLEIHQSDPSQPQTPQGLKSAGFQRLQSLRLMFPEAPNLPEGPATTIVARCQGPFQFAANPAEQGWTASFFQNVEMERNNPDRSVDRLTAHEVHLTLTSELQDGNAAVTEGRGTQFENLDPALFVARGRAGQGSEPAVPARLSIAQNGGVTLLGDEIYLDLRTNFLSLSTRKEAGASPHVEMTLADQYKIRSEHTLQYTLGQNGAFGKFASVGRGDLTGRTGEGAAAKDFYLTWNEMQMEPYLQDLVVLRLSRGITARMTGFGIMTADSLDLVCSVVPSKPDKGNHNSDILLDHAVIKDNVLFETASGTCQVKQLTFFFTNITTDGRQLHSRWMPQILVSHPPVAPSISTSKSALLSAALTSGASIQQVQHLQPLAPQSLTPMQPLTLYQAPAVQQPSAAIAPLPAPAYGARTPTSLPQHPYPRPAAGQVETQNLLGIKSSPGGGKFAMTGDQMRIRVQIQQGQSFAERVAIEGNVRLAENTALNLAGTSGNTPNTGIEIAGETVTIWNPGDSTTTISIQGHASGGDAVFKGKGVELRAREVNISRSDNKFWSPGPGRLIANTAQITAPGAPSAGTDNQLIVEWNKEMVCDGLVLQFEGQPGNGNRVQVLHQTQTLWCNILEIMLNRRVMFFDDQSPVEPKAVEIKFVHDVVVRNQQMDAQGQRGSVDFAKFVHLHYDVERNYFVAAGPGEMSSIFRGSGQGFDLAGTSGNAGSNESLNNLSIWFLHEMQGTMLGNNRKVDIKGRVEAVYCPAASWSDTIARENISAARRMGYILQCEHLQIVEVPDPLNLSQSSMELTASIDALIEGSKIFGRAQRISYNQAKSTVQMDGRVNLQTTVQGQRMHHQEAESIRYNIETGAIEMGQTRGFSFGQ